MSIHWREWAGGRVSAEMVEASARAVAHEVRVGRGTAYVMHYRIEGDTLVLAHKGPSDSVTIYEARIVRTGEEAKRATDPAEPSQEVGAHGRCSNCGCAWGYHGSGQDRGCSRCGCALYEDPDNARDQKAKPRNVLEKLKNARAAVRDADIPFGLKGALVDVIEALQEHAHVVAGAEENNEGVQVVRAEPIA